MGSECNPKKFATVATRIFLFNCLSRLLCVLRQMPMPKFYLHFEQKNNTKTHEKWKKFLFIFMVIKSILVYLIFFFFGNNEMSKQSKRWTKIELFLIYESISMIRRLNGTREKDWNSITQTKFNFGNYAKKNEQIYRTENRKYFCIAQKTEIESIKSSSSMNENFFHLQQKDERHTTSLSWN